MATGTVRITGLNETLRALNLVNKNASRVVRGRIAQAAEPVAATARERISRYPGASVGTIGPRVVIKGAFVTQRAKKRTGLRGDFGALQMRHLIGALGEHEDNIVDEVEDALDDLGRLAGF